MPLMNRWIELFQRRILWGEFLHRAADGLAIFCFIFGTAVLLVRLLVPTLWPHVLWLALGSLPVAGWAWWAARQRLQSRRETVAMLDQRLAAGGLLMTLSEQPDSAWNEHLPRLQTLWSNALPRILPKRFTANLALPLVFAIAVCFVPLREARSTPITAQAVAQNATQQLEELKQSLEEAQVLEEQDKQQLEEEVARLQEETKDTPLTHENWETVDALTERLQLRVEEAAAKASKFSDAIAQLAKASSDDAAPLTPEEEKQLEEEIEEGLEEMIKKQDQNGEAKPGKSSNLSKGLKDKLERLTKNGKRPQLPKDAQERQELLDELKEELAKEKKKLSELRKKCKACSQCKGEGEEGECEEGFSDQEGEKKDGKAGRGGVTRGRADAPMVWGDESDAAGAQFKEIVLPPGFADKPKDEIAGVQLVAPTEEPSAQVAKGAQRDMGISSGETTWNRRLSPRHRNVVRKYFDGK